MTSDDDDHLLRVLRSRTFAVHGDRRGPGRAHGHRLLAAATLDDTELDLRAARGPRRRHRARGHEDVTALAGVVGGDKPSPLSASKNFTLPVGMEHLLVACQSGRPIGRPTLKVNCSGYAAWFPVLAPVPGKAGGTLSVPDGRLADREATPNRRSPWPASGVPCHRQAGGCCRRPPSPRWVGAWSCSSRSAVPSSTTPRDRGPVAVGLRHRQPGHRFFIIDVAAPWFLLPWSSRQCSSWAWAGADGRLEHLIATVVIGPARVLRVNFPGQPSAVIGSSSSRSTDQPRSDVFVLDAQPVLIPSPLHQFAPRRRRSAGRPTVPAAIAPCSGPRPSSGWRTTGFITTFGYGQMESGFLPSPVG